MNRIFQIIADKPVSCSNSRLTLLNLHHTKLFWRSTFMYICLHDHDEDVSELIISLRITSWWINSEICTVAEIYCVISAHTLAHIYSHITEDADEAHKQQNKTGLPVWRWVLSDIHPQAYRQHKRREHGVLTPTCIHFNHRMNFFFKNSAYACLCLPTSKTLGLF